MSHECLSRSHECGILKIPQSFKTRNSLGIICFGDVNILVSILIVMQREFITVSGFQLCLYLTPKFVYIRIRQFRAAWQASCPPFSVPQPD